MTIKQPPQRYDLGDQARLFALFEQDNVFDDPSGEVTIMHRDPSGNEVCLYHAGENRLSPPWRIPPLQ